MNTSDLSPNHSSSGQKTPYLLSHVDQDVNESRSPCDPITITDSWALMALTIAGLMNEEPPELFLLDLIDSMAHEYYADLGQDMLRQYTYQTREEHEALLQSFEKQPNGRQPSEGVGAGTTNQS